MALTICVGNPEDKPASYTRFVLPFAYKLTKVEPCDSEFCYRKNNFENKDVADRWGKKWREQYLTRETSKALFERAGWFILEKKKDSKEAGGKFLMNFNSTSNSFDIEIAAPRLILFEYISDRKREDLLQTGFLIVEVFFKGDKRATLDNLLELNERFRYKEGIYEGHEAKADEGIPIARTENIFASAGKMDSIFDLWEHLLSFPITVENSGEYHYLHSYFSDKKNNEKGWDIHADTRAFVWTCAIIPEGGNALKKEFNDCSPALKAHEFGHWIKLLNVDEPKNTQEETHSSVTQFEREWAKERTYHRWEEAGTFYGFNYHSGALLGPPRQEPDLWKHFGQMYFDLAMLLLYLRVTLFRFSDRLFKISADARGGALDDDKHEEWAGEFDKLRWQFTLFTNLYQFPLISNQQQGVELYSLARKYLDVDALYEEVQQEIHSSYEYLIQKREQSQTEITTLLTVVASVGAVIGLAIGLFALKPFESFAESHWVWSLIIFLAASSLIFILVIIFSGKLAKCFKRLARSGKQVK